MIRTCLTLLLILNVPSLAADPLARGSSEGMAYIVEAVATVPGVPWGMAFVAPDRLLITLRQGELTLLDTLTGQRQTVTGGPRVMAAGQGGLLDVAVPPVGSDLPWIYFTYSRDQQGQGVTTLARARLERTQLQQWQDLLVTRSATHTSRHFGSRIAFDHQGHLFFTLGDRGHRPNGQDLSSHAGSILRVDLQGRAPKDNPFIHTPDALAEIWSYGHRNPQGVAFDTANQRLWAIEHGPRGGDEINRIKPGANYGWPVISYGKEYWGPIQVGEGTEREGMEQPVKVYIPSIAPGSLLLYSGKAFPAWRGNLLAGALKLTHLNRVQLDDSGEAVAEERLLGELNERIRALVESPEGWLYLSTDSGKILRLRPSP